MSKMTVRESEGPLVFFDFATHYGGSFQSTVQLVRELRHLTDVGVIDVYGTCDRYIADLRAAGVTPIVLLRDWSGRTTIGGRQGIQRVVRMVPAIPDLMKVVVRLRKALREIKPKAIWLNSEKALFVAWLAAPRDLPVAIYIRAEMRRTRPYCAFAWHRPNAAIGLSAACLQYLRSTGYAHGNLKVVYSGIDVDTTLDQARLEPRSLPCNNRGTLRVVFPATIASPLKGHEIGIRGISEFVRSGPRAVLWICGDVPPGSTPQFCEKMHQLTSELNLQESVRFLGWRDDILSVMARAELVLLPSYSEGLPRSLLQAMALGKPVIATRVGGIPELVRDGTDGILVNPGDVEAIVKAMRLLTNPNVRERMGQSGRTRVRECFSLRRQAHEFLHVIDMAVAGEGRKKQTNESRAGCGPAKHH